MNIKIDELSQQYSWAIFRVIELCYTQNVTTTWRDIFLFLRIPSSIWYNDPDLDEKIIIESDEELEMMRTLLQSKHSTLH